jgi:hypothetical protein
MTGGMAVGMTVDVLLHGIGVLGPGLAGWAQARGLLAQPATHVAEPTAVPAPQRLPANERRRAGTVIKAALAVADEAVAMADADPARLATVFASSTGDPANCHALCEALAAPERSVSPTRFTNSVHNAAAGYWHIATHSMRASTSIAAYDASFGAGLIEAALMAATGPDEVLFVACDVPYPQPLHAMRPVADTFAVAFVLGAADAAEHGQRRGVGSLRLRLKAADLAITEASRPLEAMRLQIPAARCLPLLERLASHARGGVVVEALEGLPMDVEFVPA